jgi:hypothetical protein
MPRAGSRPRISQGRAAGPSEVFVSQTGKDLTIGSGLVFEDVGEHELKGARTAGGSIGW